MKALLLTLLMSIAGAVQAQYEPPQGFFYDRERSGEGIMVTVDGDKAAFALFTYWDSSYTVPPVVGPGTPEWVYFTDFTCDNCPVWYVGTGKWDKKFSSGVMYTSIAVDYPNVVDESLDEKIAVGDYFLIKHRDGYSLHVDCYDYVPPTIYMCSNDYYFTTQLIGGE